MLETLHNGFRIALATIWWLVFMSITFVPLLHVLQWWMEELKEYGDSVWRPQRWDDGESAPVTNGAKTPPDHRVTCLE